LPVPRSTSYRIYSVTIPFTTQLANRKNGVSVDDKYSDDCESYRFSAKSIQKNVQLHTNALKKYIYAEKSTRKLSYTI